MCSSDLPVYNADDPTKVDTLGQVAVVISKGPDAFKDLRPTTSTDEAGNVTTTYLTETEARTKLLDLGYFVETDTVKEYSNAVPAGQLIDLALTRGPWTQPADPDDPDGQPAKDYLGTVQLTISEGKHPGDLEKEELASAYTGKTLAEAIQLLTDNHYTVDEANDVVHEKNNVVAAGLVFKVERIGDYSEDRENRGAVKVYVSDGDRKSVV